jgi:S-adenosylmethionine-dependent methyltransferase
MSPDRLAFLATYWNGKASLEPLREQADVAKRIHTDLLRRLIERHLPGSPCTLLDAGGGTGRFSIQLAAQGNAVTHLDLSLDMIKIARTTASDRGVAGIDFIQGSITDLSTFPDRVFDIVLCIDSPISFCHGDYGAALDELTRVSRNAVVFSVMNRTSMIMAGGVDFDLTHFGTLKTVKNVFETGNLLVDDQLLQLHAGLMPSWHAFTPEELQAELLDRGFRPTELAAIGALSSLTNKELLLKLVDSPHYQDYLDFEEKFDALGSVLGGGYSGAGNLAIAAVRR